MVPMNVITDTTDHITNTAKKSDLARLMCAMRLAFAVPVLARPFGASHHCEANLQDTRFVLWFTWARSCFAALQKQCEGE